MKSLAELESQEMTWIKAQRRRLFEPPRYELVDGDGTVLATITRKGTWRSTIEVDAPGNRWTMEYQPRLFKKALLTIVSIGTGEQPAVFDPQGYEGTLTYPDGRVFHLRKHQRLLKPAQWTWTTEEGEPLLGIEVKSGWQTTGEISLDPDIALDKVGTKAPPLLLFLGWYLILLEQDAQAAASASNTAAMVATTS